MMQEKNQQYSPIAGIVADVLSYAIKYAAYSFLAVTVLLTFAGLVIVYINFFSAGFEQTVVPILNSYFPSLAENELTFRGGDILKAFFYLTIVVSIVTELVKLLIKKRYNKEIKISLLKKILIIEGSILTIYILALASVPSMVVVEESDRSTFYIVFGIFCLIAMAFYGIYIGFYTLADTLRNILKKVIIKKV
jgi:hypothetical protein